jgi:GAF domain-containing protein
VLLAGVLGRYAESRSFGELAIRLHERQGSTERACEVNFIFALPLHYSDPARRVLDYLARAHEAGLATGDFLFLSYSSLHIVMLRLGLGDELSEVGDELERNLVHVQRTKDKLTLGVLSVARQMIASLMGETEGLSIMSGDGFDELAFPEAMDKAGLSYVACFYYVAKLQLLYLQGDYEGARAAAELAEHRVAVAAAAYFTTELSFYACLTLAALASADAPVDQEGLPSALVSHAEKLAAWAAHGPANYRHKHLLVQAEIARLAGSDVEAMRLYDEAIAAAEESGFLRSEALANERCAMFHAERGRPKVARAYLSDARGGYLRWGAVAKVEDLERKHPHLLARSVAAGSQRDLRPTFVVPSATTTTSRSLAPSLLDAATAVEAAQAIAGEILVDKVIHRLMQLVIETAGAQRGVLLLDRDGELLIEATVAVDPSEVRVGLGRPLSPIKESGEGDHDGGGEELAVTIVQYVARTREPVVLDDAVESRFACDPYVAARRPRSILCQAMTHQGRLTGVLYLENNAAGRAFTPARLTLCGLLSSQAAIAVENARFRARLEGMTDELRRANERLEEEVCERTKELRRTSERLERELAERARSEEEHAVLQEEVIRAQKARIEELSTPLIPINDRVMVMPLVGSMDASRAQQVLETALCGAQASRAEVVILDITGVKLVDAGVASSLISTASALRLLGTRVVLTGVGPRVAQALVAMNVDLGAIVTKGTLQGGIAYATALRR